MSGRRMSMAASALVVGVTLVAGAMASSQATNAGDSYKLVGTWGKAGSANGQFDNAFGLVTDRAGNLHVADTDNHRIQVFSAKGAFLRKWGTRGNGNGQFESAQDIVIDAQGSVWVADRGNERVQGFGSGGAFQQAFDVGTQPSGIGVDAKGNLYVAEFSKVVRYDKASGYATAKAWGSLKASGDLEVSPDGSMYVADNGRLRVIRYDLNGKQLGSIGGGQSAPIGIGVDLDCNLWMTNTAQRRIDKRSPSGKLLATAASADLISIDVAVGRNGDVYASDNGVRSIVRFAENRSKPRTASIPGTVTAVGGTVKIAYTLSGIACPAVVGATATLSGSGIAGKAAGLKLKVGARNTIAMKLSKAASGKATFKIVLRTNGRPTTETRSVTVVVK